MKLADLNPSWVIADVMKYHPIQRRGMGVSFDCPVHRTHKLAVMFTNPIDGMPPAESQRHWSRTGETFDTLTLSPSVDASEAPPLAPHLGFGKCWHGHITNGEVK